MIDTENRMIQSYNAYVADVWQLDSSIFYWFLNDFQMIDYLCRHDNDCGEVAVQVTDETFSIQSEHWTWCGSTVWMAIKILSIDSQ